MWPQIDFMYIENCVLIDNDENEEVESIAQLVNKISQCREFCSYELRDWTNRKTKMVEIRKTAKLFTVYTDDELETMDADEEVRDPGVNRMMQYWL